MKYRDLGARREDLDRLIRTWKPGDAPPRRGWLKEIRESIGLPGKDLAKRMNISQPALAALERSEVKGTARLASLKLAAEKMGCTFSYIIAPPRGVPLADVLREAAIRAATLPAIGAGLRKYAKGPFVHEFIARHAAKMRPEDIWDDTYGEAIVEAVMRTFPMTDPEPEPADASALTPAQRLAKGRKWKRPPTAQQKEEAFAEVRELLAELAALKTTGLYDEPPPVAEVPQPKTVDVEVAKPEPAPKTEPPGGPKVRGL